MTTLANFLLLITSTLVARVVTALSFGFFSYAAFQTLATAVVSQVTAKYGSIDSFTLSLLNLAGGGQVLGIILAALTTRASLMAIKTMRPK